MSRIIYRELFDYQYKISIFQILNCHLFLFCLTYNNITISVVLSEQQQVQKLTNLNDSFMCIPQKLPS